MLNFEQLLEQLQTENLTLEEIESSQNPEVLHALTGKVNQDSIDRFNKIIQYIKPYPIDVIEDSSTAISTIMKLKAAPSLGLDIETSKLTDHPQSGLNPKLSQIRLVQLFDGQRISIFDCHAIGGIDWFEPLQGHHLIAHNAVFEAQHFYHAGITFTQLDCTMLMGRVFLNKNMSLKEAAKDAFDLDMDKSLQISDWSRSQLLPEQILYAALDAVIAYQLHERYQEWFSDNPHYRNTYNFLRSLVYPLVRQQSHGIKVDILEHRNIIGQWESRLKQHQQTLAVDGLNNPGSNKQVQVYLKNKLTTDELSTWPKTKTNNLSADSDALSRLTHHPTLSVLAEYKTLSSRLGNFGEKLHALLIGDELHPNYQIAGMITGRFGCNKPNIQNQPRSGFKHIYIAPEGWQFVTGDLSQVELRVAGLLSEDAVINQAYANGQDLHRMMAAKMTGKSEVDITKEERTAAKGVNFGLLFGGGARGLQQYVRASYGVNMSLAEAEHAKSTFHATYSGFTFWQKAIVKHTNEHDESESIYSRLTRHFDETDHYKNGGYKDIYTHAMNHPIQSTAWELLALAIIFVDQHLPQDGSIRISHHVYDELCLCAKDDQVYTAAKLLKQSFEHAYQTIFPGCNMNGIIEVGAGKNWSQAGSESAIINLP